MAHTGQRAHPWSNSLTYRWSVSLLDWTAWDGALTAAPSVVIGTVVQGAAGTDPWRTMSGLMIGTHDYISLSYTGSNLTGVVFKTGGVGGTTIATLTLAYTGSQLTSVTKS